MIEIVAALITGIATVVAAILTKAGEKSKAAAKPKGGEKPDQKETLQPALPVKNYVWLFIVGAIAGALLIRIVAQAAEAGLNVGGYKVPVGTIVAYMGNVAPDGWLLCDGRKVEQQYGDLRRLVGEQTPDLRGRFLRGLDPTGTVDPEGKNRALGSPQEDELKKHAHSVMQWNGGDGNRSGRQDALYQGISSKTGDAGGTETRPKNVVVNFIIKY